MLASASALAVQPSETLSIDLLIVGGTESGCAAAVQAARMGVKSITLVNDIDWLGGQFSAEGLVAIDENRGPKGYDQTVPFPRAGLFKEVIGRIEAINLRKHGRARLGNTRVITTCRPADAEQAFRDLLEPYVRSGQIKVLSHYVPTAAELGVDGWTLKAVTFAKALPSAPSPSPLPRGGEGARKAGEGDSVKITARLTIDASDWGDVIKLSGADYEFGPDLKDKYGEPAAPTSRADYPLTDMNPITYCMVLVETDRYEPIPAPLHYNERNYTSHKYPKDPLWLYESRRIVDHYNFKDVRGPDSLLLCFPAFDYPLDVLPKQVADALEATEPGASKKNIVQMTRAQRQIVFKDAKQYSLGFLRYLQTTVHDAMPDKTHSYRRFELSDEFGTSDRLPPKPYIRESVRLKAMHMMRQQDTLGWGSDANNYASAMYHDGIACWQFEYDFHPTKRVFVDKGDPAGPWRNDFRPGRTWGPPYSGRSLFPLRSLVPVEIDGLMGAQKNLGYSSIVSAAVRLHDNSMAVAQGAGAVAAVALRNNVQPRAIPFDAAKLSEVWNGLGHRCDKGEPAMLWPFHDLEPSHPAFEAANQLAIRRWLPLGPTDIDFKPDQSASEQWRRSVMNLSMNGVASGLIPAAPEGELSRGDFAMQWWERVRSLPLKKFQRSDLNDADSDGLADPVDALPLVTGTSSWPKFEIPADQDGNPDALKDTPEGLRQFNFTGKGGKPVKGFESDHGLMFDAQRGFGWARDISANNRRRGRLDGDWRDSFLFTRTHDVWECVVPNGRYSLTVCAGDSDHEQTGQNVTVEGQPVLRNTDTPSGRFAEKTMEVSVSDGRLTVEIGLKGGANNTCLNWLRFWRAGK